MEPPLVRLVFYVPILIWLVIYDTQSGLARWKFPVHRGTPSYHPMLGGIFRDKPSIFGYPDSYSYDYKPYSHYIPIIFPLYSHYHPYVHGIFHYKPPKFLDGIFPNNKPYPHGYGTPPRHFALGRPWRLVVPRAAASSVSQPWRMISDEEKPETMGKSQKE